MSNVIRGWARFRERYLQRKRFAETATRLAELDRRALHDLGIDASEVSSVAAEASGITHVERLHGYRPYY
jgi:hypothetical protein